METPYWKCTVCGKIGKVGRCCGAETRIPVGPAMTCRYCEKQLATQDDHNAIPEGAGDHLCWSDFGQPCLDAEQALDIARARIAKLETIIANTEAQRP